MVLDNSCYSSSSSVFVYFIMLKNHVLIVLSFLFQKFDIWPVVVRVDYSPHHVDLTALGSGKYVELVNLFPWKVNFAFFV